MKGRNKFLALFLSAVMALGVCVAAGCGEKQDGGQTDDSGSGNQNTTTPEVKSVALNYNNAAVEGLLSMNLTAGTFEIVPVVTADEGAAYTLTWTSTEHDVATVSGDKTKATVTLNGAGETVIKADTGKKSAEFILSVEDDRPKTQYTVTVVNGVAKNADGETITKAEAGTQVTLEATAPAHKTLTDWTFDNDDVALNGYTFTMPEGNVTATANFTDTLYPLSLVGATVIKAGEISNPQGTAGAGDTAQTKETSYSFAYGTQVTIKAAEAESDKTFVGWDYQVENNRVGEMGVDEYTFTMSDDAATKYTAIYSNFLNSVWTAPSSGAWNSMTSAAYDVYNLDHGSKIIGTDNGDADLKGMSGYTLAIQGNKTAMSGYPENIEDSVFKLGGGRGMAKVIFKNYSATKTVKLEVYATFRGIISTSNVVEIGPNAVVEKNFEVNFGMENSWWGVTVREDLNGSDSEWINVDMVLGIATDLYPNGDPYIDLGSSAQLVTYNKDSVTGSSTWAGSNDPSFVFDENSKDPKSYLMLASWGTWWGGDATQPDPTRWKRVEITNMPAYEEGVATTEVYGRVINLAFGLESVDYKIVIGNDRNDPSKGVAVPVHFENIGETKIFKFEIPRTSNDETFYVFVVKENVEDTSLIGYGFVMHLTYNNVFGYEEE